MTSLPAEVTALPKAAGSNKPAARRSLPGPARLYLAGVVVAAALVAFPALAGIDSAESWSRFLALGACAALAWQFVVPTGRSHGFDTTFVFIVAAALLLPFELVVLMGVAQYGVDALRRRFPWYIQIFNVANCTLTAATTWAAAHVVIELDFAGAPRYALAGLAAAGTCVGMNHVLLAGALRLARGHSMRASGLFTLTSIAMDLVLAGLGVALAFVWVANPWLVPAVVGSLAISHHSFSLLARQRESEQQFRAMFESAPVGSALVDIEGKIVSSNRALEQMLGYAKDALGGTPTDDLVHPDDAGRDRELFRELVSGQREAYSMESRYVARDGRIVWGQGAAALVRGVDRKPRFAIGMVQDVTERKQAEQALRESEERYRELFENANDMVYTLDLDGRLTAVNRAGEAITGFGRDELLGRALAELIAPEHLDEVAPAFLVDALGGDTATYECSIVAKDGRRVPVEVATRLILEHGRPVGLQGVARDVSERRELEDRLRQAQKLEAIGLLAGGVAHDFNNMLTAITGYSHLAVGALDSGRDVRRSDLEEIAKAADRAGALTSQLLAFSRKQMLRPEVIDLNDVVGDLDKMLRRLIGEHIDVVTAFGAGLGRVKADRSQLEQVIVNLVVNARDAMRDGGTLTITTSSGESDDVVLCVSDTGHGMDAATRERIFEPFFTTKEVGQGTGLGLATVYGVVKQSGGHLSVESEPGAGAEFRIYLPSVDEPLAQPERSFSPPQDAQESETILLVEDEEIVRRLIRDTLRSSGYTVLEAGNGEEAMRICRAQRDPVDIVVTDVVMPHMTGPELVDHLSASQPELKVLYVSGYADGRSSQRTSLQPGTELLQKPFTPSMLAQKVREVLDAPGGVAA
jgi:two-component system, cell cycle sensor histidine kinase and response regulator CckA